MDGIIIVNKEKGCTSHDVVHKVKKMFGVKVGHTGTLDPNATGVLPLLIGKGTELSQFLINHDKKYIATIKLGIKTDTADVEGNVIEEKSVNTDNLNTDNVNSVLRSMIGKRKQRPPMYSAIKINGKKLYEYARAGKDIEVPEREIEIYNLQLIDLDVDNKLLTYEIHCSKGTYVRTVCEEIAEKLETVGYMQDLKRTMVGDFKIEEAVTIDELRENCENEKFLSNTVITIEKFFADNQTIKLNAKDIRLFLNGVQISRGSNDGIIKVYNEKDEFVGIGVSQDGKLKRKVVLD